MIVKRMVEGLVSSTDALIGEVSAPAGSFQKFGKLVAIRARNWSSSAKTTAGTDALQTLKLTDANSDVIFLDAADRDYKTAQVTLVPALDDTATGLGLTAVDGTGAAATAGMPRPIPLQFPVQVRVLNGATATDWFECELIVEV